MTTELVPAGDTSRFMRQLRRLAVYRPVLERGFHFGEWAGGQQEPDGTIQMPWYSFSEEAQAFLRDLQDSGWIRPFDWPAWLSSRRGRQLRGDVSAVAEASVEELGRLLTALVRQDRFAEGTLADAYESGILAAIARRADELATELDRDDAIGSWSERPWANPWSGDRELIATAAATTEIGMARDMCYGPCPVYSVRLNRDGQATFLGEDFVDLRGEHVARMAAEDFETLALALAHLRFGGLRRHYAVEYSDAQTTTTWVVRSSRRRTVEDYGGAGPRRLRQIEDLIDDAAAELGWKRASGPIDDSAGGPIFVGSSSDASWRPTIQAGERPHWTQAGRSGEARSS